MVMILSMLVLLAKEAAATSTVGFVGRSGNDTIINSTQPGGSVLIDGRDLVALIDELQAANAGLRADNAELRTGQADLLARVESLEAEPTAAPTGSPTWVLERVRVDIRDNNNPALLTTNTTRDGDLQRITNVQYDVRLERCTGITSLDGGFSALRSIGQVLRIDSNAALTSLGDGFSALEEVGGDRGQAIWIYNNAALTSLGDGFSALQQIGQNLRIYNNDALASLGRAFPALIEIGGWLKIDANDQLASLGTAFPSLQRVVGKLSFANNPLLTDFEALRNLTCIGELDDRCDNCPSWLTDKPQC